MRKINLLIILYFFTFFSTASANNQNFDEWLVAFKIKAKNNTSFDVLGKNHQFLEIIR